MSCRARELVAHRALPERGARRGKSLVAPWLAFPASSSCRGLVLRAAVPASSSCRRFAPFGWSSRQAPLVGALCLVLNTLFLNGPKRDHGGFWRSPSKPRGGTLRLPVHKSGVLRYPYFSTPTMISLRHFRHFQVSSKFFTRLRMSGDRTLQKKLVPFLHHPHLKGWQRVHHSANFIRERWHRSQYISFHIRGAR